MKFIRAFIEFNGKNAELKPGKSAFLDELYLDFEEEKISGKCPGSRYRLSVHPKTDLVLNNLEIRFFYDYQADQKIFCNGFQSWSNSREFSTQSAIPRQRFFSRKRFPFGDDQLHFIQRGKGHLHSWTYSYIRHEKSEQVDFVGSLLESTGFTLLEHDVKRKMLRVRKDCAGLHLSHSYPALDFICLSGKEKEVFDAWFAWLNLPAPTAPAALGWTSWYYHYTQISSDIVHRNLESFAQNFPAEGLKPEENRSVIFQIDDGWQKNIGDWLQVKNSFPKGLKKIAADIHQKNWEAGLWLAPFICEKNSDIFQKHPEWLLRDHRGKLVKAGWNPLWTGWFYALDFYHPGVQDYLTGVIHTLLENWGFDLLKLDFLYAVCLAPPKNKTRGQVMHEAMEFLRHRVGSKKILACGVPLSAAFGMADYCRIGADVHLKWDHNLLRWLRARERVSTLSSLQSTISRRHLNGRVFHNDPDVFILRNPKNGLSSTQKFTLLFTNVLFGNLLFTSDDLGEYDEETKMELAETLGWLGAEVKKVEEFSEDLFQFDFEKNGQEGRAFSNLNTKARDFLFEKERIHLKPFETLILSAKNQPA